MLRKLSNLLRQKNVGSPPSNSPHQQEQVQYTGSSSPGTNLVVEIQNWFEPDAAKFLDDMFKLVRFSGLPEALSVKLHAPQYEVLRTFIESQSKRQNDRKIVAEQHAAIESAALGIQSTEEWCTHLLINISKHYGVRSAVDTCQLFLQLQVAYIISSLASYQVDDGTAVCTEFAEWFDPHAPWPTLPQFIYKRSELLEVILKEESPISKKPAFETVYLPLDRIKDDGSGSLISSLCRFARYIPVDVWLEYVIPQCAAKNAQRISSYCPWVPDNVISSTDGRIWVGTRRLEYLEYHAVRGRNTKHFIVQEGISSTADTVSRARQYLHVILDPPTQHNGPYHFFPPSMDLPRIMALGNDIITQIECIDARTWRAPSTWHAAVWLMNLAGGTGEGKPVFPQLEASTQPLKFRSALLFRGQKDSIWGMRSLLSQSSSLAQDTEALLRFSSAMIVLTEAARLPILSIESQLAAAQFYGMPTHLLDVTFDPLVATFFACKEAQQGEEVVVYWIPFNKVPLLNLGLIFPPPWVQRFYKQRGLFIDLARNDVPDITSKCYKILFPCDASYIESGIGNWDEVPFPDDSWFINAGRWARESNVPISDASPSIRKQLADDLYARIGKPSFISDFATPQHVADWSNLFLQLLEWVVLRKVDEVPRIDCFPLSILRRDNVCLFAWFLEVLESLNADGSLEIGDGAKAILTCLHLDKGPKHDAHQPIPKESPSTRGL